MRGVVPWQSLSDSNAAERSSVLRRKWVFGRFQITHACLWRIRNGVVCLTLCNTVVMIIARGGAVW
jgi:hypothetical protein